MANPLRHLRQLLRAWLKQEKQQPMCRRLARTRLRFEELEDRIVPVSTNTAVSGALSGGAALPSSIVYGTPVFLSATVTAVGGSIAPTLGGLEFMDGALDLGPGVDPAVSGNNLLFTKILTATQLQVIQANGGVHTITAAYSPGTGFNGSTGTLVGGLKVSPAPLTITATANTKTYDSTASATAIPTVSGLIGSDTVTGLLSESYDTANAGTGKTLSVNTIPPAITDLTGNLSPAGLAFDSHGNLFVVNNGNNTVSEFAPGATTPSATLTGLNSPLDLVFDGSGNLYVTNFGSNSVSEFAPGTTTPSATLTGLNGPENLAFDSHGNLFVANYSNSTVSEFAPGATTPSATLTGLFYPTALAVDGSGNLFVANYGTLFNHGTTVSEFAPGATTPSATLTGVGIPSDFAFDSHGNLFVANSGLNTVSEFAPGTTTPSATLTGQSGPFGLAFDGSGNLYVTTDTIESLTKFAPGGTTPIATLTGNNLRHPGALAFDGNGNLYVAANNMVIKIAQSFLNNNFAPVYTVNDGNGGNNYHVTLANNTTGVINKAPLTIAATSNTKTYDGTTSIAALPLVSGLQGNDTVSGLSEAYNTANVGTGKTLNVVIPPAVLQLTNPPNGLTGANALAVDLSGNLYVTNGSTVVKFASGATTPSATLTGLSGANCLAVDKNGNLFVSNSGNNTVSEFYPGAITPSATLTGVTNPGPLVIDGNGNLFVANHFFIPGQNDTLSMFAPGAITPSAIIANSSLANPTALNVDSSNDLFVANAGNGTTFPNVIEFSPGATKVIGNAVENGDLTSIIGGGSGYLATYGKGNSLGEISFLPSANRLYGGFSDPVAMAFGGNGFYKGLYVVNKGNNTVSKFDYFGTGAMPPLTGLVNPQALAFDSLGNLYVLNAGSGSTPGFVSKFVPSYIDDGDGGQNYTVTAINNTTGVINPEPISNFIAGLVAGPNGFTATFNKPLNPAALTLYGLNLTTPQDVTLRGSKGGPIHGSLIFDPSNMNMTFVATASYVMELNSMHSMASAVLPDDTYTITFLNGSSSNGFLLALEGGSGPGLANYTTTFTTSYQHNGTPVLSIPDFARGPDSNTPIEVPNVFSSGVPITLYDAAGVTDVTFSLTYNPALLNIGAYGGAGSDATDQNHANLILVANSGGVATFHYTDPIPISATPTAPLVLGDITAVVPSGPGATALSMYQVKALLQLGNIVINHGAITGAVSAISIHVNAYLGDVNGDGVISGLDTLTANMVAQGQASGFSAYAQLDPVIIGDVASDNSIDAGDVTTIDSFVARLHPLQIPMPPTQLLPTNPNYLNPSSIHSPNAADPTLSLTRGLTALGSPVVSVMIDHPDPEGSTGLTSVTLALIYDPALLSVPPAGITLGSLPNQSAGWQLTTVVDQATGQVGMQLYSPTPITVNQAGSLVKISFQWLGEPTGVSPLVVPAVQLVDAVTANGQWFGTGVADSQGAMILGPGVDQLALPTGADNVSAPTLNGSGNTETTGLANRQVSIDALTHHDSEKTGETTALLAKSEYRDEPQPMASATLWLPAIGATQPLVQSFQIGNLPLLSAFLYQNSSGTLAAERLFLDSADSAIIQADLGLVKPSSSIWDAFPELDWLGEE
jgi:sugar lactone lactonase YvrE